ncbi:MAG TPA: hypothetical protein VK694_03810 [Verrucomicrobiae bacterium]|nr:hypothetical protein [Verrucomicrobiae bacterium]
MRTRLVIAAAAALIGLGLLVPFALSHVGSDAQPSESSQEDLWCPPEPITHTVTGNLDTRIDLHDGMWYNATYAGSRLKLDLMVGIQPALMHPDYSESEDFSVFDSDAGTQHAIDEGYYPIVRFLTVPTVDEDPIFTYIEGGGLHVYVSVTPVREDGYPQVQIFSEGETLRMTCEFRR